jgi:hypothetical protein
LGAQKNPFSKKLWSVGQQAGLTHLAPTLLCLHCSHSSLPEKGVRPSPFYQYSLEINLLT